MKTFFAQAIILAIAAMQFCFLLWSAKLYMETGAMYAQVGAAIQAICFILTIRNWFAVNSISA